MSDHGSTRRRVLATAATAGAGAVAYGTDNPLHRSSVAGETTRRADGAPAEDAFWFAEHAPEVPDADVTQLLGARYLGSTDGAERFDVLSVAVGRQSSLLRRGPLVGHHRLGLRGVDDTATQGADKGGTDALAGGVVEPPAAVTEATGLDRQALDDPDALADRVGPTSPLGSTSDLATARRLLDRYDRAADDRLSLAGVLYALGRRTHPKTATPEFEGRGETYRWPLDGVVAHAARYRPLYVHPGDDGLDAKFAAAVPRPSLLGSPVFENALRVSLPA